MIEEIVISAITCCGILLISKVSWNYIKKDSLISSKEPQEIGVFLVKSPLQQIAFVILSVIAIPYVFAKFVLARLKK